MRRLGLRTGVPARGRESALDDDVRGEAGAVEPDGGAAGVELAAAAGAPVVWGGAVTAAAPHVRHAEDGEPGGESFGDAGGSGGQLVAAERCSDVRVVGDGDDRAVQGDGYGTCRRPRGGGRAAAGAERRRRQGSDDGGR